MNRPLVSPTNTGNSDNFQSNGMRGYLQLMGVIESKAAIFTSFNLALLSKAFWGLTLE
jgi:hypothetical protein